MKLESLPGYEKVLKRNNFQSNSAYRLKSLNETSDSANELERHKSAPKIRSNYLMNRKIQNTTIKGYQYYSTAEEDEIMWGKPKPNGIYQFIPRKARYNL